MAKNGVYIDIEGTVFGRLKAIEPFKIPGKSQYFWKCLCDCGKPCVAGGNELRSGAKKSCGCLKQEVIARGAHTTHGGSALPEYAVWQTMWARCSNPKNPAYSRYGGRGIEVDAEWGKFENFLRDMGPCPPGLTLERVQNSKGYSKSNCIWATRTAQARNRRSNRLLSFMGHTKSVAEWAEITGLKPATLWNRLNHGWAAERILFEDTRFNRIKRMKLDKKIKIEEAEFDLLHGELADILDFLGQHAVEGDAESFFSKEFPGLYRLHSLLSSQTISGQNTRVYDRLSDKEGGLPTRESRLKLVRAPAEFFAKPTEQP